MNTSDERSVTDLTSAGLDAAHLLLDSFAQVARAAVAANPLLKARAKTCCDIPPACWLPRDLGELTSNACPCGTALVRLRIENCQPRTANVSISASSDADLEIKITPASATLAPMQRKWFTVGVTIPDDACPGESYEVLVWVAGCNEYYLRWTVKVADGVSGSCHEVVVEDCPDYVHHWYDHFYCERPCFAGRRGDNR